MRELTRIPINTWRITCIVVAILFIIVLAILFFSGILRNRYYRAFKSDELIKQTKTTNSVNKLYFTSGETQTYIRRYVVCKTLYDKYLVCNFVRQFKQISYFVAQYSKSRRVIHVARVFEADTGTSSRVISLNKRCEYVNVIISTADNTVINSNFIRPIAMTRAYMYAFLKSLAIFLALYLMRHAIVEILSQGDLAVQYLNSLFGYAALGIALLVSVLSYVVTVMCLRRKNINRITGGALEYEFV